MVQKIDLVYTFVNPLDEELSAKRRKYTSSELSRETVYVAGPARYRDNGELRFSIACAQRNLPFLNRIFVVMAGSAPSWLVQCDKLTVVNQDDILPPEIIPVFSSEPVESYIYKIPGLAEHYLYSNDDFFFSRPREVSDFFNEDGCTRVAVSDRFAGTGQVDLTFKGAEINSVRALCKHLRLAAPVMDQHKRPRLSVKYLLQRVRARMRGIPLINTATHVTQPFLKSYWPGFHEKFAAEIALSCSHRFRSDAFNVNLAYHHYLRSVRTAEFYFEPHHLYLDRRDPVAKRESVRAALLQANSPISQFCLNDAPAVPGDGWSEYIADLMAELGYNLTKQRNRREPALQVMQSDLVHQTA